MADPPEASIPPPDPPDPPNLIGSPSDAPVPGPSGGVEPSSPSPNSSSTTPPWLRWSRSLNSLLDDPQGRDLFERYLEQEGCSAQLTFLWACEGLKETAIKDPPKIPQLVRKIYRHFIQNLDLLGLREDTRSDLAQAIVDGRYTEIHIFSSAEREVLTHMQDNLYPNFLQSELYLCAVNGEEYSSSSISVSALEKSGSSERRQSVEEESSITLDGTLSSNPPAHSSINNNKVGAIDPLTGESIHVIVNEQLSPRVPSPPLPNSASIHAALLPNQLQTVHEDLELSTTSQTQAHSAKFKLTKEALRATQLARATDFSGVSSSKVRKNETAPGHYLTKSAGVSAPAPFPYHASYSSYNPVSRVDSEIQSLSSDAMTDDGAHGSHHSGRKPGHSGSHRPHGHNSNIHPHQHQPHPDGQRFRQISGVAIGARIDNVDNLPMLGQLATGAQQKASQGMLAEKNPKKFADELIKRLCDIKKSAENNQRLNKKMSESDEPPPCHISHRTEPNVLAAAINKIQNKEEEEEEDILDKHMSRVFADVTPKTRSPRLRSPTIGRRRGGHPVPSGYPVPRRRERDIASTFSGDSGNVRDYSMELSPGGQHSGMAKSRSIPHELKLQLEQGDFSSFGRGPARGHHHPSRGGGGGSNSVPLGMTKRTSMEFVDSGISVVSGATQTTVPQIFQPRLSAQQDDVELRRIQEWVLQCSNSSGSLLTQSDWVLQCAESRRRGGKKIMPSSQISGPQPAAATLNEVAKRLLLKKPSASLPSTAQHESTTTQVPLISPVGYASTIATRTNSSPPLLEESTSSRECITSLVLYDEARVPFVLKIPKMRFGNGSGITLAAFKQHLPKRGNYRYFFQTESPEFFQVVREEIFDDSMELPLHEGRIFAHLQSVSGTSTGSSHIPGMDK